MKKILIYDHDRTFCLRLAEWVDKNKFEVRYSDDHKVARKLIANGLFDIIVIYVSCLLCDGMRLATDILDLRPTTPVLCALDKDDNALLIRLIQKAQPTILTNASSIAKILICLFRGLFRIKRAGRSYTNIREHNIESASVRQKCSHR